MVEFEETPTPDELADICIFALSIANLMGWDMNEEIRTKVAYNHTRYIAKDFQEGDYETARLKGKAREKEVKQIFYKQPNPPILNPQEFNQE
jgi:hypothetical protein